MKIRGITLTNVRRFTQPTRVEGIGDGLNVLCEPNEIGKSTLFDAIQALFFKAHGSRDRDIKALQPHSGGAPEIRVEVETEEGRFEITKRWLSKPDAWIERDGRLVAQADAAEEQVARLLGGGDGPSSLLWVRQGMTGLKGTGPREDRAALEARRDLMSSVGHEVEAMTGGRRMDAALARCRAELAAFATSTGRPKANGPWKAAEVRVEALEADRGRLSETARELREALDARRRHRRDLAELDAPEAAEERRARVQAAQEAHETASRHAEEVAAERRRVEAARLAAERAGERRDALRGLVAEREAATGAAAESRREAIAAAAERDAAATALETARTTLEAAEAAERDAEARRRTAERHRLAREGAARRAELERRIAGAEAARREMEQAGAAAGTGPDDAALRHLEALATRLATAEATRDATAPQVIVHYAEGRSSGLRVDGRALSDGEIVPVPRRLRLDIDGIGAVEVTSSGDAQDDADVAAAGRALGAALDEHGADGMAAAREAGAVRADAIRRASEARAVFRSLAPDGLDPLRADLAAIPVLEETADAPDPEAAAAALSEAEEARVAARGLHATAQGRHDEARIAAARAEAEASAAEERRARATEAAAQGDGHDLETLERLATEAAAALDSAAARLDERARAAPDLAAAEAALSRATSVEHEAREAIARLRPEIARLDERISRGTGDGVEDRLAEVEQDLEAARADLSRISHEVAVLQRLEAALDAAKREARDRYFEPVAAELRPLLSLLWPDAELTWEAETILPTALVRNGTPEPVEILSGGTGEQVALLVRLAFARMLARAGRHAPVILDDALIFTDDERIERMFDALHRQADDLQIIVLTCRQRAFRALGGRTLALTPVEDGAA